MNRVKWGVLSTAKIGVNKVVPGMQKSESCEIVAISSRDIEKARSAAEKLGLSKAYGSYEALLADPEIDAIYNPLPNHLHVQWSIKALEAGKHVLCEKPIGLNLEDAERLWEVAQRYPSLKVMEAFMYRFHPQWIATRDWMNEGDIGELRTIQSHFSYYNVNSKDIRNQAAIGGGGLLDIGCYCISLARFLFGGMPKRVMGMIDWDPSMKVDRMTSGMLEFDKGTSSFTCSTQLFPYQRVQIMGSQGRIELEIPFNAPPEKESRVRLFRERGVVNEIAPIADQYSLQGDAFSKAILEDLPVPTSLQDALDNMRVIDALFKSAAESAWISL